MIPRASLGAATVAACLLTAAAAPTPPAPSGDAKALGVIAQAKAAMGADAWERLQGWHEVGVHNGGRYESWLDPRQYGMASRDSRGTSVTAHGFDGQVTWRQGADGVVVIDNSAEAIAAAKQSDYLRLNGYFIPGRFKADASYAGSKDEAGRSYDIVHVTPAGDGADVWFDSQTHLPWRAVIRDGATTITIRFADYRLVDGVLAPFHTMISDGDPAHDDDARVTSLDFGPADRSLFAPPADARPAN